MDVLIEGEETVGFVQTRAVAGALLIGLAHQAQGVVDALAGQPQQAEGRRVAGQVVRQPGLQHGGAGHDQVHGNLDAGVDLADLGLAGDEGGVARV